MKMQHQLDINFANYIFMTIIFLRNIQSIGNFRLFFPFNISIQNLRGGIVQVRINSISTKDSLEAYKSSF